MLKNFVKKRFNYYLSRSEYYDSVVTENSFIKKISLNMNFLDNNQLFTEETIFFNNKLKLNSSYKEIIEALGEPSYEFCKSKLNNHTILFYKKLIGALRTRFELHLIEDSLIIGFITFDVFDTSKKLKVINALTQKYDVTIEDTDLNTLTICDEKNNYIRIIDSVHLTLAYGINTKLNNEIIFNISNENEIAKLSEARRENLQLLNNI